MNREQALERAIELKECSEKFELVSFLDNDKEFFEYVVNELESTAHEVPVQEQYVTLKIDSKEIDKVVIDEIRKQQKHYNITLIPV